jgi:cytochrome c biogenesis protein CcmG/thiol:disulfide interchange protein DsbE
MRPSSDATVRGAVQSSGGAAGPVAGTRRARLLYLAPAIAFAALLLAFFAGLGREPGKLPSALLGKPVPEFSLLPVQGRTLGLSTADLKDGVSIVNVFASWCVPCREEHPLLMRLAQSGAAPVHGINYKDKPADAARWLDTMGDPYRRTGADIDGRVSIDWGVYGVPETFIVDGQGRIAWKQIGAIDQRVLDETILPLIARLRASGAIGASQ